MLSVKFENKVRTMTAKDIIMSMVEGLKETSVILDMGTFGTSDENGFCYGCAATNTICKISGITFTPDNIDRVITRARVINSKCMFLDFFERAINSLRLADLTSYNYFANKGGFANIAKNTSPLYPLRNDYTQRELASYITLANEQK